jgi:hypothetical protein
MALLWFGQHGSDHQYHSALDHGHYDGLHLSVFNRGQEVLHDYGFGRWVNVEPKFGGRYIPENKSYCKQTVAHNTVTVDQSTQNNFDTATAESRFGSKQFFKADDAKLQGMSGKISEYYEGVDMQRSVLLADIEEFEKPLVIDVYRIKADKEHSYDLPVHFSGQIIRTDFEYNTESTLRPMGENFGYQHLWNLASGDVEGSSLVSWLHGNSYYSLVTSAVEGSKVYFARLGANDPNFNLRSEPALILRQSGQNHVFASALETHGYFNEEFEASVGARGLVEAVTTLADNDDATVIEVTTTTGNTYRFAISNREAGQQELLHEMTIGDERVSFTGSFAQL